MPCSPIWQPDRQATHACARARVLRACVRARACVPHGALARDLVDDGRVGAEPARISALALGIVVGIEASVQDGSIVKSTRRLVQVHRFQAIINGL